MAYNHTQHGRWHYLFLALSAAMLVAVWLTRRVFVAWLTHRELAVLNAVLGIAAIFALCGLVFGSLTIRDEGDHLALRFGPLPVLRKTFRYADITGVEIGRTSDHRRLGHPFHARPRLDLQPLGLRLREADAGPEDHPRGDRRRGGVGEGHSREDRHFLLR